jgi:hypothetical protein
VGFLGVQEDFHDVGNTVSEITEIQNDFPNMVEKMDVLIGLYQHCSKFV